jgi:assimilatory nitrate reductase catalytic subunit
LTAPGRLTAPLMKNGKGKQQPASWDTALDTVASEFRRLLDEHGSESVAILSTGQLVTEEFYTLGKLARLGLGLAHYDGNTTLCMASAVSGYKLSFGSDGPPGCYDDLALADVVVLIGANVADNHPLLAPRLLANKDAHVIAIDPRVTKTAMVADQHLALKPRGDIALLNGIIKVLVDEDLVDHDYIAAHTTGYDELVAHVAGYPLDRVASECGLPAEAIRDAALRIGRAERAFVAWTMGVNHSVQGSETVALINTLCLITGNIGRAGSAPFSITGQCNAMGTREAGFTASMPGYRPYDDAAARAELAELLGIDEDRLPTERGRAYPDIVNAVVDGRIKGLWIIATNPTVSFPNRDLLEDALGRLDLLVVQDGYSTPTTVLADVVLPAAVWGEKDGTFTNSERRVSRVRKVVDPPGEARSDFAIFLDLAARLGVRDELYPGWTGPQDAFEEWRRISAGRLCDYSALTWDDIEAAGGIQWGGERLYGDGVFPTPDGRARIRCVDPVPITDKPRHRFPLLLNTGRTVEHWHTRTKTGRVEILERLAPEAWVEVNPADARSNNVRSGDVVRLVSERGAIERIVVRVTSVVREGEVFVPFHYDEACANRLTLNEFDPISREPNYKQCAVRLERSSAARR